jgi:hypothetical protein
MVTKKRQYLPYINVRLFKNVTETAPLKIDFQINLQKETQFYLVSNFV